jgi:GcrA cell cycle regulator
MMSFWDAEGRVDELLKLAADGLSSSRIAKRLGTTRNAVISKLYRMGIDRGKPTKTLVKPPRGAQRKVAPKPSPSQAKKVNFRSSPEILELLRRQSEEDDRQSRSAKPLLALEAEDCRWPIGDPLQSGFGFCAKGRVPGLPYCEGHAARAYHTEAVREASPSQEPARRKPEPVS